MRRKVAVRFALRAVALALASCTALSGVDDLEVGDDGRSIDAPDGGRRNVDERETGAGTLDASFVEDALTGLDAPINADAGGGGPCNEPGLVAYWKLDEGTADTVRDCTPNALDGKMEAGTWTTGKKGGAILLGRGTKAFVGFGSPALLSKTGAMTVMAWVRQDFSDAGLTQYIVGKTTSSGNNGWRLATEPPAFSMSVSGDASTETVGGTVVDGTWTHVAVTYDPGVAVELYVNGQRVVRDTNSRSAALVPTPAELRIGTRSDGSFPFAGAVDDVRIYDRVLAEAEIAARAVP